MYILGELLDGESIAVCLDGGFWRCVVVCQGSEGEESYC